MADFREESDASTRSHDDFQYAPLVADFCQQRGVFLVLGAGVSHESELPDWKELIRRMFSIRGEEQLFKALRAEEVPLPVMTSLLEDRVAGSTAEEKRNNFEECVRDALYGCFPFYRKATTAQNAPDLLRTLEERNTTLRAVSAFCARPTQSSFERNPAVRAVVTFNLDTLLESHSRAKYGRLLLRTIERPSARSRLDRISVYHVHGHLRFDDHARDLTKEAPDQLVLTEQDYFDFFNSPTSIFNYTFLHLLREHNAIFVGLSLRDDNLRRLLHYSKLERVRALRAEQATEANITGRVRRHVALMLRVPNSTTAAAWEATAGALGVHIQWLESYDDIPTFFRQVYEKLGSRWSDVF